MAVKSSVKLSLSGSERENLMEAMLEAYPDYDSLEIMVDVKLEKSLARICKPANQETVIFKLIKWAEKENQLLELIWGAYDKNSESSKLQNITYKLCCITQEQWSNLCQSLSRAFLQRQLGNGETRINRDFLDLLEAACQESFTAEIVEIDDRLVDLKNLDKFEEIETILKDSLIKKQQQSSRNIPSILEFADCLSKMSGKAISIVRDELKSWVSDVAEQLKIKLETKEITSLLTSVKTQIIQPYLLISLSEKGANFLLQGELVIEESERETVLKHEPLYIKGHDPFLKCAKKTKELGDSILQYIRSSYLKLRPYGNKNEIIIELFLTNKFLLYPMEKLPLELAGKIVKLGCQYQLIFRSFERFEFYKEEPEHLYRLETNWRELKSLFQSQSPFSLELVKQIFEDYASSSQEGCQALEQRLRDNKKLGINIVSPLDNNPNNLKIMSDIMWAINVAGVPLSFWSINKQHSPETIKNFLIKLLTYKEIKDFLHLLSNIQKLRGKVYTPDNPKSLGYGLGFLCDNPNRVLSCFDIPEDDGLTFGS
ncbi:MAG: effector-associated domain EAD1-containing protein [Crocosphaera sp.]